MSDKLINGRRTGKTGMAHASMMEWVEGSPIHLWDSQGKSTVCGSGWMNVTGDLTQATCSECLRIVVSAMVSPPAMSEQSLVSGERVL